MKFKFIWLKCVTFCRPQTTIGTAMVLCHRFFVRRSHACHDRYLIATAGLFLAAKSEETPRPLNDVLRASSEIFHNQDVAYLMHPLHIDWFERYRERVIEAEQMILTTLNFELSVQHPYGPLTCVLGKLGYSQTVLVNLALSLVSEGVYTKISVLACMILLAGGLFGVLGKCFLPLKLNCRCVVDDITVPPPTWLIDIRDGLTSSRPSSGIQHALSFSCFVWDT
uniref:B-like cyclin n=1 Tax=Rhizophora mucronata TaxID=61149 RepID=A0A2P2LQZ0_RHIMU